MTALFLCWVKNEGVCSAIHANLSLNLITKLHICCLNILKHPNAQARLKANVLLTRDFCSYKQQIQYPDKITWWYMYFMWYFGSYLGVIISFKSTDLRELRNSTRSYSCTHWTFLSHRALAVFWGTWVFRGWEFRLRWGEGLEDRDWPVQDSYCHRPLQEERSCLCRR